MSSQSWQAGDAEQAGARLAGVLHEAVLRRAVYAGQDCSRCSYLADAAPIAFCEHPRMQILVDSGWWCQWWEERDDE